MGISKQMTTMSQTGIIFAKGARSCARRQCVVGVLVPTPRLDLRLLKINLGVEPGFYAGHNFFRKVTSSGGGGGTTREGGDESIDHRDRVRLKVRGMQ